MKSPTTVKIFAIFDSDGSGAIDVNELKHVMLMLDPCPTNFDAQKMFEELDINDDGAIDCWEFCAYVQRKRDLHRQDEERGVSVMDTAFQMFDTDGDGSLDSEELRKIFQYDLGAGSAGLTDAEFTIMLNDLGLGPSPHNGQSRTDKIRINDLRWHPAFMTDPEDALERLTTSPSSTPRAAPAAASRSTLERGESSLIAPPSAPPLTPAAGNVEGTRVMPSAPVPRGAPLLRAVAAAHPGASQQ